MEKKTSNKSINKLIYAIMAAMLAVVILVSVFTVSSRRRTPATDTAGGGVNTSGGTLSDTNETPDQADADDTNAPTLDTSTPPYVDDGSRPDTSSKPAASEDEDVLASNEIRYYVIPVAGAVSKAFEVDIPVYSLTMNDYRAHTGVDIHAPLGSDVVAVSSGNICRVWSDPLMGSCIMVDHGDGIYTTYMNLAEESPHSIEVGQRVSMGQAIGTVGDSALVEIAEEPHLHLEMKVDGKYVDPLDYMGISAAEDSSYEG